LPQALALYPESADAIPLVIGESDAPFISNQLEQLGFTAAQVRTAITFLSMPSAMASNLLRSAPPLEACIEYLVLHIPECDLPQRFLPDNNSSNPFITGAHHDSGSDDLKKRWIEERAIKDAGWPAPVVHECMAEPSLAENLALLIEALNKRLVGEDWRSVLDTPSLEAREDDAIDQDEVEYLGGTVAEDSTVTLPLLVAPIQLHFVVPSDCVYNKTTRPPPMYITSSSLPAYVRLHFLSELLDAFKEGFFDGTADSICVCAMQLLVERFGEFEDKGPPDLSQVMRHLMPQPAVTATAITPTVDETLSVENSGSHSRKETRRRGDRRTDAQIREDFEAMRSKDEYIDLLVSRKKLPAFSTQVEFLSTLRKSRVVVVVGETGEFHMSLRAIVLCRY